MVTRIAPPCEPIPISREAWFALVVDRFVVTLQQQEIPLTAQVTVACLLVDLLELAGVPVPEEIGAAL